MLPFCVFLILLSSFYPSDAKTYRLKVRTSKYPGSGTGEDVKITLYGSTGKTVSKTYDGWGLGAFEAGSLDDLQLDGDDIGPVTNIEAQIVKTGKYFDSWRLFWIKAFVDGDVYKGTFEYWFGRNWEKTSAKRFEVVRCREGYQESNEFGMRTCRDRNECLVTCKGANQQCINLPGKYTCKCKPGYYLDGTICRDYDECSQHNRNPCNYDNAYCVNLPGSYECRCKKGYHGDYNSCQDKDECQMGQHDCSQKCINTPGSFKCDCNAGFKMAVDGKTCLDVDECQGANSCNKTTSVCYDEYGGHRCVCKVGYREHVDTQGKKSCIPVECQPLTNLDKSIILSPSRCQNGKNLFRDECTVQCATGYELKAGSAKTLKCSASGFASVDGSMPVCTPKPCKRLTPPDFGYTVPPSCSSQGTTQGKECHIYCDQGFLLVGDRTYKCDQEKYDKDPSKTICTKIPKIKCPDGITVELPKDKNRVALENRFPFFETNMGTDKVTANIPDVGPHYEFALGYNVVVYTARNEINQTDKCSFVVRVVDKTPPAIEYCPENITVVSKGGVSVNVTWTEPRFKDNVQLYKVSKSSKSGIMRSPTSFLVSYVAYDTSGNTASCRFKVNFQVLQCDFKSISGGDQAIQKSCFSTGVSHLCAVQCSSTKTFDVLNSNHAFFSFMWHCDNADFGVDRIPDCVDFVAKNGKPCPKGSIDVLEYRMNTKVCAKCPRGTYFSNGTCISCSIGTYQSNEGSLACNKCQTGFGTSTTRNKFASDCKALCPLGYRSNDGISNGQDSCKMCPKDTYSDHYGSTTCEKCPNGTNTDGEGRTSASACRYAPKNVRMVPSGKIEASAGDEVVFDCFAEGNPLPFMHIRRQKSEANPLTHSLLPVNPPNKNTRGTRYRISKTSIYDSGIYACKAENAKGIVYKKIELIITEGSGMAPVS